MQNTITSGDFAISFIQSHSLDAGKLTHSLDAGKLKCHTCDWELPCDEVITSRLSAHILEAAFEEEAKDHIQLHWAKKHREEIQAIEKELK